MNDGDVFHVNQGFSEKLYRIKINSIQMKETEEENKKTNDQVRMLLLFGMQGRHQRLPALLRLCRLHCSLLPA